MQDFGSTSSTAAFRATLLAVPCLALGVYLATHISSAVVPVAFLGCILMAAFYYFFCRSARLEGVIISVLILGYLIGNRGFAQFHVLPQVYIGEAALAFCVALLLIRHAVAREKVDFRSPIARFVFLYLVAGLVRAAIDYKSYDAMLVARDFAAVYYCVFFFIGIQVARFEGNRHFIARVLSLAIVGQAVVAVLLLVKPALLDMVTIGGMPLLMQKDDLTATFSVVGIFALFLRKDLFSSVWLRRILIIVLATTVVAGISRSALLALILTSVLLLRAGRKTFLIYWVSGATAAAIAFLVIDVITIDSAGNPRVAAFRDKLLSMTDFSGHARYGTVAGDEKADDNDFRRTLWSSIISRTTSDNPIFGKGFGYDFLPQFERIYGRGSWDGLRSPHNYFVTAYGRLGIVGIVIFGGIGFFVLRNGLTAAGNLSKNIGDSQTLGYWCAVWVLLIAGTFGVVLEGPMGGILFWSFLGFAVTGLNLNMDGKMRETVGREIVPDAPVFASSIRSPEPFGVSRIAKNL